MYERLLIPTDGSELSETAIRNGVRLASALGAKVIVLTVTPPFHIATLDAAMLTAMPELRRGVQGCGRALPACREGGGREGRRSGRVSARGTRPSVRGDHRHRVPGGLRPDLHGLARSPRRLLAAAGKRDQQGPDP